MEEHITDALETIDAALLTGDTFQNLSALQKITEYIERWQREINTLTQQLMTLAPTEKVVIAQHTPQQREHIKQLLREHISSRMVYSDKRKTNGIFNIGGRTLKFITYNKGRLTGDTVKKLNKHIAGLGVYLDVTQHPYRPGFQIIRVYKFT